MRRVHYRRMTSIPEGRVQDDDTGPIVIHRIGPREEEPAPETDEAVSPGR